MDADTVVNVGRQSMEVIMILAAPIQLSSLHVGHIVAMFQADTQINEMTLSFFPKLFVVALVMMAAGPWMLSQIVGFTQRLVEKVPYMIG